MKDLLFAIVGAGAGAALGCTLASGPLKGARAKCKETLPGKGGAIACDVFIVGLPAGLGAYAMLKMFGTL